jgi:cell division protein FtsL
MDEQERNEINNRSTDLMEAGNKISRKQKEAPTHPGKYLYLKLLICILLGAVLFFVLAVLMKTFFGFYISDASVVMTLTGILATFVVISNYTQVKDIKDEFDGIEHRVKQQAEEKIEELTKSVRYDIEQVKANVTGTRRKGDYLTERIRRLEELMGVELSNNNANVATIKLEWIGGTSINLRPLPASLFKVTITNPKQEQRLFYEPWFELSVLNEKNEKEKIPLHSERSEYDSEPVSFPVKLEYGESVSSTYTLLGGYKQDKYQEAPELDKARLQAFVKTTLGEEYHSNKCPFFG